MKRILLTLLLLLFLTPMATPVFASLDIQGIYYNFDAAENEWALKVKWTGRPYFEIKANEFYPQEIKKETETVIDVENRIQEKFKDLLCDYEKLSNFDPEDPVRQDPPILLPFEKIVIIKNQEYLETWKAYFRIHIYSLDNLETPRGELKFITRFQNPWAGSIPDNWWQLP